jgi:hypothetical protein
MYTVAFTLGFFTAIGWWSATKVTGAIDRAIAPPVIQKGIEDGRRSKEGSDTQ